MSRYRSEVLGLDCERTIWVDQEELGHEKAIEHRKKRYKVEIPGAIDRKVTLRLRGLGRTAEDKTGDLLLHIRLNKGDDIRRDLWLSEASARQGARKILSLDERRIEVVIPRAGCDGLVIRLRGLGRKRDFTWHAPLLRRNRGNLLVKLRVYPTSIAPNYGSFDMLSDDDMALEGWVYRKLDEVLGKAGEESFPASPLQADAVADAFNEHGWRGIFDVLVRHLGLTHLKVGLTTSDSITQPGNCQRTIALRYSASPATKSIVPINQQPRRNLQRGDAPPESSYAITINEHFLDNPFSVAAILAHELCHVVYAERIDDRSWPLAQDTKTEQESKDEERTVDLLVFMFKMGEFQLRVARDSRLTIGYFNQRIFERIRVIVARRIGA